MILVRDDDEAAMRARGGGDAPMMVVRDDDEAAMRVALEAEEARS